MNAEIRTFACLSLLGAVLAFPALRAEAQAPSPQPEQQADQAQNPEQTAEEKKKAKEKKQREQKEQQEKQRQQQLEDERKQQPQQKPPDDRQQKPPPPRQPQDAKERQREVEAQKQKDREVEQKREQQERQAPQKRVSKEEQQARISRQEQQLALYRKNIALREQLAERNEQVLRQQNRIQQLRFQQQYEERLRAQRAELSNARYDYSNDPFYYTAPNYRYARDGRYYNTNQYGIRKLEKALQAGYNEGYKAGRADYGDRWRYDYRSAFAYQDANYGYDGRYIAEDEYNHYFREGFQRGYDDGYYGRNKYGRKNDSGGINDEWLIAGAVVAAIIGYQVLTD